MTPPPSPSDLAAIHREAFDHSWDETSLAALMASPGVLAVAEPAGFILVRFVADEAEILTLAVRPSARRAGLGRDLVERSIVGVAALGAREMFLEVAESNVAARALYTQLGFVEAGRRRHYYARADGVGEDAMILNLKFRE